MDLLREEDPEPEPYASITRLESRLGVTRHKAAVLLMKYGWKEHIFDSTLLLSDEYQRFSRDEIENNPHFDYGTTLCAACWNKEVCQNVGCGHYVCNRCFLGKILADILDGDVKILCPFYGCHKFVSHDFLQSRLSQEEVLRYKISLKNNYELCQTIDTGELTTKPVSSVSNKVRELGSSVWGRKREICLIVVPLMIVAAWRCRFFA